jgi:hypothetical protein
MTLGLAQAAVAGLGFVAALLVPMLRPWLAMIVAACVAAVAGSQLAGAESALFQGAGALLLAAAGGVGVGLAVRAIAGGSFGAW